MIGVTIGVGGGWLECAVKAADRMQAMTGITCLLFPCNTLCLDHGVHPSWCKHLILGAFAGTDEFLYFDADILALKPWNPEKIFKDNGRRLCAVLDNDPAMASQVRQEEKDIGILRNTYLNAGLFIFGREHAPLFESTWAKRPSWHRWIDQGAFNRSIHDLRVPVAILPNEYNHMRPRDASTSINMHYCGLGGNWQELKRAQDEFFSPTEGRGFVAR